MQDTSLEKVNVYISLTLKHMSEEMTYHQDPDGSDGIYKQGMRSIK